MDKKDLEEDLNFTPRFDQNGLIPCIATDAQSGEVLMFAYMNQESLNLTIQTSEAHYWSRSRSALWHKGATSGFVQRVIEIRTDCDQDCLWIKVEVKGQPENRAACHTGRKSCFYRKIKTAPDGKNKLDFIE